MSETNISLFETKVLPENHYVMNGKTGPQARKFRDHYQFNNESIIVLGSIDNSDRILSSEWDIIWVEEGHEIEEHDWNVLLSRLRNSALSFKRAFVTCNPQSPLHWLHQRKMNHIETNHNDNPTHDGKRRAVLEALTGVDRERLLYGNWVAAEGQVYPSYNTCLVEPIEFTPVYGAIDWGFDPDPCAIIHAAKIDNKLYIGNTYKQKRMTMDDIAKHLQKNVMYFADSNRPDSIDEMRKRGFWIVEAKKDRLSGRIAVSTKIQNKTIMFNKELKDLIGEFSQYCHDPTKVGEKTLGEDHLMDALRYLVMGLNNFSGKLTSNITFDMNEGF
jgi:PBSX family phage terminase large subunit